MVRAEACLDRVRRSMSLDESERFRLCKEDSRFIFIYKYLVELSGVSKVGQDAWDGALRWVFDDVEFKVVDESLVIAKCAFAHTTLSFALVELEVKSSRWTLVHVEFHT